MTRGFAWSKGTCLVLIGTLTMMWFLSGCAPRGETKSTDQVLELARSNFEVALASNEKRTTQSGADSDVMPMIKDLLVSVEGLAEIGSVGNELNGSKLTPLSAAERQKVVELSGTAAASLATLTQRAGYTARPAMGSLANQFRSMHFQSSVPPREALNLIVARVYHLLASELNATAFKVA